VAINGGVASHALAASGDTSLLLPPKHPLSKMGVLASSGHTGAVSVEAAGGGLVTAHSAQALEVHGACLQVLDLLVAVLMQLLLMLKGAFHLGLEVVMLHVGADFVHGLSALLPPHHVRMGVRGVLLLPFLHIRNLSQNLLGVLKDGRGFAFGRDFVLVIHEAFSHSVVLLRAHVPQVSPAGLQLANNRLTLSSEELVLLDKASEGNLVTLSDMDGAVNLNLQFASIMDTFLMHEGMLSVVVGESVVGLLRVLFLLLFLFMLLFLLMAGFMVGPSLYQLLIQLSDESKPVGCLAGG